jgi:hypothetical protein
MAAWGDEPPGQLAHILLGGAGDFQGRTPDYTEFHELDGKLWVLYKDHGWLVYSREGGNMTEQRGRVQGRPGAEFVLASSPFCPESWPRGPCAHPPRCPTETACRARNKRFHTQPAA